MQTAPAQSRNTSPTQAAGAASAPTRMQMSTNDGATPFHHIPFPPPGMTLRDYFAGQALMGFMAAYEGAGTPEEYANWCFAYADAMLKARDGA